MGYDCLYAFLISHLLILRRGIFTNYMREERWGEGRGMWRDGRGERLKGRKRGRERDGRLKNVCLFSKLKCTFIKHWLKYGVWQICNQHFKSVLFINYKSYYKEVLDLVKSVMCTMVSGVHMIFYRHTKG